MRARRLGLDTAGVRIAADDTGAGYSGLQHLLRLRPNVVKLDIALTRHIDAVDQAKVIDIDRNFRVVALAQRVPDALLEQRPGKVQVAAAVTHRLKRQPSQEHAVVVRLQVRQPPLPAHWVVATAKTSAA